MLFSGLKDLEFDWEHTLLIQLEVKKLNSNISVIIKGNFFFYK